MKTLPICVLIGICFIVKGVASETINCYVCDECGHLDSSQLRACPLEGTTISPTTENPTTVFTESTTLSTEESTLEGTDPTTTVSPKPTEIVTDPPKTEPAITETPKPETTTVKTEETEPAEAKQTSAAQNSSEIKIPINVISESVETFQKPSKMASSEIKKPTNDIPEVVKPSLIESSEVTPGKSNPGAQSIVVAPKGSAPAAQYPSLLPKPEAVNSNAPAVSMLQSSQHNEPYQIFNPRGGRNSRSAPSYHCYTINIIDGDAKKEKKGCVEVPEDKSACDILKKKFGESVDKCRICTTDKCNSSSTLKYSLITLVMLLVVSFY